MFQPEGSYEGSYKPDAYMHITLGEVVFGKACETARFRCRPSRSHFTVFRPGGSYKPYANCMYGDGVGTNPMQIVDLGFSFAFHNVSARR